MNVKLNGRVSRLETTAAVLRGPDHCRSCGLGHVRPLRIALLRGVLHVAGGSNLQMERPTQLCLCVCCTTDPGDRWFVRLSHGLPADEDAP